MGNLQLEMEAAYNKLISAQELATKSPLYKSDNLVLSKVDGDYLLVRISNNRDFVMGLVNKNNTKGDGIIPDELKAELSLTKDVEFSVDYSGFYLTVDGVVYEDSGYAEAGETLTSIAERLRIPGYIEFVVKK